MDHSKVAVRYAKAAFEFALEQKKHEALTKDFKYLMEVLQQSKEFFILLENPMVKTAKKMSIINELFSDKFQEITINVIKLVIKNKREKHLKAICNRIEKLYKDHEGIRSLEIKSAAPLDNETRKVLSDNVKNALNANKLEISEKTDKNLIGGFVLRLEDLQYDASVKTQLENFKKIIKEKSL